MNQSHLIYQTDSVYIPHVNTPSANALQPSGPNFLEAAGHPIRWTLLRELARSDRKVRELTELVRERQGLVSYHLGRLRAARLVSMRRSSADGRDAYYTIDLTRCRDLIAATAEALHPGLKLEPAPPVAASATGEPARILFLCTGNSARSQMAEVLLESLADGAATAKSAGSRPKALHPLAVRIMAERGLDISGKSTKGIDEFREEHFDIVVTLCDRVREVCPEFPGAGRLIHWSIPDPAVSEAAVPAARQVFRDVADDLASRIQFLLRDLPAPNPGRKAKTHAR